MKKLSLNNHTTSFNKMKKNLQVKSINLKKEGKKDKKMKNSERS